MHILIVTNHFWPENFRINELAVGLKNRGHDITVFTGVPDYPEGRFYTGYGWFKKRSEDWKGVRIHRFPLIPRGNGRALNLILNYLSSLFLACLHIPFVCRERYDAIFVFDTSPVTIGLPAVLLKKFRSIPLVFWVLDLWPESLSATGAVTSPKAISLVKRLVRFIYSHCDRILVSSNSFKSNIKEIGGYDGKVDYFPNWVENEYLFEDQDVLNHDLPEMPGGFKVMFAGNIGAAQDFPTILAAAECLRGYPDIHWIILGDGRKASWVKDQVKSRGLEKQFHQMGRFPAETMPHFFQQADAMLLTLKNDPIFELTVPGKLQSYFASGKPVIGGIEGEGASIIREAQAGFSCPAASPELLAKCVLDMYELNSEERQAMGKSGQAYCNAHFDRDVLFARLEDTFYDVVAAYNRCDDIKETSASEAYETP
ncbi:glycosyltransferase WbuB [Desulfoluna limicola]|uniref:Glycosyltransferase WbuB n=1 Tax=Desulfoluna limicola TaxID=2810562 RepID=A0ABM7PEE3_9BACT|nr:glycosyltransferase family 4 protein [Desulfoluna limicola]BCS95598.1 glycosyltransferase WbuB [Desulfoluna limicola]